MNSEHETIYDEASLFKLVHFLNTALVSIKHCMFYF